MDTSARAIAGLVVEVVAELVRAGVLRTAAVERIAEACDDLANRETGTEAKLAALETADLARLALVLAEEAVLRSTPGRPKLRLVQDVAPGDPA